MLPEVGMPCIPVLEDNEGAVQLTQTPITKSNSKHIDARHHFLRNWQGGKKYLSRMCRPVASMHVS